MEIPYKLGSKLGALIDFVVQHGKSNWPSSGRPFRKLPDGMVWTKKDLCGLFTISYHVGFWVEPDTSLDRLPTKHKTLGMRCSFHRLRFHPVFCSVLVRASRRGASCGTRNGRLRCHCPGVRLRSLSCGAASSFHVVYKHLFRHRPVPCKWCLGWHKQLRDALGLQLAVCHTMDMACSYLHRDLVCT